MKDFAQNCQACGQHIIYGLFDPVTKELKYIGITSNQKRRYVDHHNPSKLKENTYKNNWIKSLLTQGLKAEMVILETYETAVELPQAEIELIEYYRSIGCNLVNGTNGGDSGMSGRKSSEETRKKISEARKKHKSSYKNCVNCEKLGWTVKNRCHTCDTYYHRHNSERPLISFIKEPQKCKNCDNKVKYLKIGRCNTCYCFFKKHNYERKPKYKNV